MTYSFYFREVYFYIILSLFQSGPFPRKILYKFSLFPHTTLWAMGFSVFVKVLVFIVGFFPSHWMATFKNHSCFPSHTALK